MPIRFEDLRATEAGEDKRNKMANVNLETGKISGCEKWTKTYYHEKAHLIFEDKCDVGNTIRSIQDLSFKYLVGIMAIKILWGASGFLVCMIIILLTTNIVSEIYEEVWCWNYAKNVMREKERDKRGKEIKVSEI
jgi:hypothetical protein